MPPTPSAPYDFDAYQAPDPATGGASFLVRAVQAGGPEFAEVLKDLQDLQREVVKPEPQPKPALSGLQWVRAEFERLRMLPFAQSDAGSMTDPKVRARDVSFGARVHPRPIHYELVAGRYWPTRGRITVTIDVETSRALASELLLHELVHAACRAPFDRSGRQAVHGIEFRTLLIAAADEAYGLVIDPEAITLSAWRIDDAIVRELHALGGEWRLAVGT